MLLPCSLAKVLLTLNSDIVTDESKEKVLVHSISFVGCCKITEPIESPITNVDNWKIVFLSVVSTYCKGTAEFHNTFLKSLKKNLCRILVGSNIEGSAIYLFIY